MKRHPIRSKIQNMVLWISIAALLITSAVGIISMMRISQDSEKALTHQMEQNLRNITAGKANIAMSGLDSYARTVENFALYITGLYAASADYPRREVLPPRKANGGILAMQRSLRDQSVNIDAIRSELELLGNVEAVWSSEMRVDRDILTTIYFGTESGIMLSYDTNSDLSPDDGTETYYDYSQSQWYSRAKTTGRAVFTDVYLDSYGRGLTISCAAPFYDQNGEFAGAVGMDILITNLYKAIVDIDLGKDAYAFLVDGAGKLILPEEHKDAADTYIAQDKDIGPEIAHDILAGKTDVSLSDSRIYFAYTPIFSTGWKFCVRIPESVILAPVRDVGRNIILTMVLFIIAFVVIIVLVAVVARTFSERLTTPIIALGRDVQEISSGNLDYRAKIYDNDEIGDLAKRFNYMALSLKDYIHDLAAVTAEKERIGAELNVATQIQADMLPKIMPPYLGNGKFEMFATMNPAKEVGGDFYDFFLIDDDHLALVMADVSGKGVPAALFMVIAKTLIKNRAMMGGTPGQVLADVNNQLCEGNEADLFVTVWLGIMDLQTGKVTCSNAGHEYPAIKRVDGNYELFRTKQSPAVATMEGLRFRESEFFLNVGDCFFIYTDGVPEATNIHDELYGTDRMIEALNSTIGMSAEEVLRTMKKSVDDFTGEAPQFDDVTMLSLRFLGKC